MGQCISNQSNRKNDPGQQYDIQPTGMTGKEEAQFPTIQLHTFLTKIKLKRCGKKQVGIRIDFAGFEQFQLKPKFLINETARWEIEHLLEFKTTIYQMYKKFLVISLVDNENSVIGHIKINLYLLATGPYHQDFAIPLPKCPGTRLSFNIKIAQRLHMKLKIHESKMMPIDKEFPGDMFAFGIRSIIGDRIQETPLSYKYLIGIDDKSNQIPAAVERQISNIDKSNVDRNSTIQSTQLKKQNSSINNETAGLKKSSNQVIHWSQDVSKQMPYTEFYFPLYDLHGATFNIIFYSFKDNKEFHSECFISYNKLANYPSKEFKDSSTNITWQIRQIQIEVKTWDHGKQSGKATFRLTFTIQKHIKQMQVCVRTEKGILESSPVFQETSHGASKIPQQLQQLQKLSNQIQNLFIEANNINKSPTKNQMDKWMSEVNKRLKRQKEILNTSAKESKMMFVYQDERALLKGQRGLIKLGSRTKSILNEDRQQIAQSCWQLLFVLMKRGELTLAYIGYNTIQIQQCLSGNPSQFLKRKRQVSLSYHSLMVDLLNTTLQSLQTYNYEGQRQFAELFCAFAYFRIPKFRNQILTAITHDDDPEIQEWRGTEFSLTEKSIQTSQSSTAFSLMFDWQNHFYKVIQKQQEYNKTQLKLIEMLKANQWENRMKKRGGAFFAFVRFWVRYVEEIAINSKHVSWRYFPGYNKILLSYLAEMKLKNVTDYSQAMRKAGANLLSNERLLNPFVLILLKKTNSSDQISILKTFDLIHVCFSSIIKRGRTLPTTFDLKILFRAMKLVLEGQSAFSIGKVLLLLYDHFKFFPVQFRIQVSLYLMSKVFFKLFLHWSQNVRTIFHHFLFIRIYHESSKPIGQIDSKDQQIYKSNPQYRTEIISRYRKLILILENAQQFQHKLRTVKINNYQTQTYKKMKTKIAIRRRQYTVPENISRKANMSNKQQYNRQIMTELAQPRLQRYSSQLLAKNLKVAVENTKAPKKEQVIIRMKNKNETPSSMNLETRKRKLSFFQQSLQDELTPLKEEQVVYVRTSLEEYHKINEMFIKHIERNKQSVPVVRLELALDQKELRPEGLTEHQQW